MPASHPRFVRLIVRILLFSGELSLCFILFLLLIDFSLIPILSVLTLHFVRSSDYVVLSASLIFVFLVLLIPCSRSLLLSIIGSRISSCHSGSIYRAVLLHTVLTVWPTACSTVSAVLAVYSVHELYVRCDSGARTNLCRCTDI